MKIVTFNWDGKMENNVNGNGLTKDLSIDKLNIGNDDVHSDSSTVFEVPKFGVKLKFNHTFPEKRTQNIKLSLRQSLPLIPLAWR